MLEQHYKISQVAKAMALNKKTVERLITEGHLIAVRGKFPNSPKRIPESSIKACFAQREVLGPRARNAALSQAREAEARHQSKLKGAA